LAAGRSAAGRWATTKAAELTTAKWLRGLMTGTLLVVPAVVAEEGVSATGGINERAASALVRGAAALSAGA
jgi:hypothetical protein